MSNFQTYCSNGFMHRDILDISTNIYLKILIIKNYTFKNVWHFHVIPTTTRTKKFSKQWHVFLVQEITESNRYISLILAEKCWFIESLKVKQFQKWLGNDPCSKSKIISLNKISLWKKCLSLYEIKNHRDGTLLF